MRGILRRTNTRAQPARAGLSRVLVCSGGRTKARSHVGPFTVATPSSSGTNIYLQTAVLPGGWECDNFSILCINPSTNVASGEAEKTSKSSSQSSITLQNVLIALVVLIMLFWWIDNEMDAENFVINRKVCPTEGEHH